MLIRPEKPQETGTIYGLIKTAFETAKVKDGTEQDYATKLRSGKNYVPDLALVIEEKGMIIGHIMLTKFYVGNLEALLLAPVSIALEHRNKGMGSNLINEALKRAKNMGYKAVLVVGDPVYYSRFGFSISTGFGIRNSDGIPDQYVMALELHPGSLKNLKGDISFYA